MCWGDGGEKLPALDIASETVTALSQKIKSAIDQEPMYFAILAEKFSDDGFQAVARALGILHEAGELWQDKLGQFCLVGSSHAAAPPGGRG